MTNLKINLDKIDGKKEYFRIKKKKAIKLTKREALELRDKGGCVYIKCQ